MIGRAALSAAIGVGVLFVAAGCAERGAELQPVRGRLLLDGAPLPWKEIRFLSEPSTGGLGGGCQSDGDGAFELIANVGGAVRPMKGAVVGSYRAIVTDASPPQGAEGTASASSAARAVAVPAKYRNPNTSPLRVEVIRGANDVVLELNTR